MGEFRSYYFDHNLNQNKYLFNFNTECDDIYETHGVNIVSLLFRKYF